MQFDPDVVRLLELMREANLPSLDQLSPEQGRLFARQRSDRLGGEAVEVAETRDLLAEGPGGPLPLRLYRPHAAPKVDAPALVFFHGGGWVIGDLDTHDRVCRRIADRAGCLVVAVDYRLAPEHPGPAAAEDAVAALGWIAAHAADLGVDPLRLAVGGDSAGGNLSAVAALAARDAGLALRAQVLIYPSTDLRPGPSPYGSRRQNAQVPPLTQAALDYFADKYVPDPASAQDWRLSPILAADKSRLAPALVITAEHDVLRDEGLAYAAALEAAGVAVERLQVPGMIHGFITMGGVIGAAGRTLDAIADFLRRHVAAA